MVILVTGIGLRFFRLGEIPYGLTWDEAAITYDSWGISLWRRDQWAERLPLVFKSFGDYKAPLAHYVLAALFLIMGDVDPLAIRVLSATAGVILIASAFGIARFLFPSSTKLPLLAALLTSLSAYDIHLSRIGLEAHLATALISLGVLGLLLSKQEKVFGIAGIIFLALSMYAYQSPKMVVPLLGFLLLVLYWKQTKQQRPFIYGLGGLFLLVSIPLLISLKGGGGARAEQALLFFSEGSFNLTYNDFVIFGRNLLAHLSIDFWVNGVQDNFRHIVPGFGVLYLIELPLLVMGIIYGLWRRKKTDLLLLGWLLVGLLPSTLGRISPHTIRAAGIIPVVYLIESLGAYALFKLIHAKLNLKLAQLALTVFLLVYLASLIQFHRYYYGTYAIESPRDFQYGYEQAYEALEKHAQSADKVVFTDAYGQPYIYSLLYRKITPQNFQSGALANYEFRPIKWPEEKKNTVFVGTPEEIPLSDKRVIEVVTYPHSPEIVFVIARTP